MCVCVNDRVRKRGEREIQRENERERVCVWVNECVGVVVCERDRSFVRSFERLLPAFSTGK